MMISKCIQYIPIEKELKCFSVGSETSFFSLKYLCNRLFIFFSVENNDLKKTKLV